MLLKSLQRKFGDSLHDARQQALLEACEIIQAIERGDDNLWPRFLVPFVIHRTKTLASLERQRAERHESAIEPAVAPSQDHHVLLRETRERSSRRLEALSTKDGPLSGAERVHLHEERRRLKKALQL